MRLDVVRRLLGLMRGQWSLMVVSSFSRVVNQALGVLIPALAAGFVVQSVDGNAPSVSTVVWVLILLALVKGAFRYLEQFTGHAVAFRLLAELRSQVFRWLERLEPARLEGERSGDLVERVSGDISRVEPFYAHTIAPVIAAVVVPLASLVALGVVVSLAPAAALLAFVVLYLMLVPWIGRRIVESSGPEARRLAGESAAATADVVQGASEIAVLGAGREVLTDVDEAGRAASATQGDMARWSAWRSLAGSLISAGAVVAVAIAATGLEPLGLVVSIVVAWTTMAPLRALEEIVPDTEQALAAAERLFELEDIDPQQEGDADRRPSPVRLLFDRVTVGAGARALVDNFDLEVEPGTLLGIVGPSGSGKTTLVQTLVRHRDASAGRVLVGGVDVRELSPSALRAAVALVPQRPDVFYGSLRSNLTIACPGASDQDLLAALERAQLGDFVGGLDLGLDALLGERGVGLSGGQLQRLALARAFLRDPDVLILDEATSELDAATESAVLSEIFAESGRRTVIVVAHRMETIVGADRIAVMDRGRLVETGTHERLNERGGLYAALWERHEDMLAGS